MQESQGSLVQLVRQGASAVESNSCAVCLAAPLVDAGTCVRCCFVLCLCRCLYPCIVCVEVHC